MDYHVWQYQQLCGDLEVVAVEEGEGEGTDFGDRGWIAAPAVQAAGEFQTSEALTTGTEQDLTWSAESPVQVFADRVVIYQSRFLPLPDPVDGTEISFLSVLPNFQFQEPVREQHLSWFYPHEEVLTEVEGATFGDAGWQSRIPWRYYDSEPVGPAHEALDEVEGATFGDVGWQTYPPWRYYAVVPIGPKHEGLDEVGGESFGDAGWQTYPPWGYYASASVVLPLEEDVLLDDMGWLTPGQAQLFVENRAQGLEYTIGPLQPAVVAATNVTLYYYTILMRADNGDE